jgi:hypothetical protein
MAAVRTWDLTQSKAPLHCTAWLCTGGRATGLHELLGKIVWLYHDTKTGSSSMSIHPRFPLDITERISIKFSTGVLHKKSITFNFGSSCHHLVHFKLESARFYLSCQWRRSCVVSMTPECAWRIYRWLRHHGGFNGWAADWGFYR